MAASALGPFIGCRGLAKNGNSHVKTNWIVLAVMKIMPMSPQGRNTFLILH